MRYIPYLLGIFVLMSASVTSAQQHRRTPTRTPRPAAVPRTTRALPAGRQSPAQHATASPDKVEAAVNQRISSLQQMLAKESKTLEVRLAGLAKKRQAAVDKGDNKTLKSIEQLEGRIVQAYETRVGRLVASMSAPPNSKPQAGTVPRTAKNGKSAPPASDKQAPEPKKRFRLWPF